MRYGRQLTITSDGSITRADEKVFVDYSTAKQVTLYTETIRIDDDREYLSEFLKLNDRYKKGEIDLPGVQLLRDDKTGQLRVEKTWTDPKDLTYEHK